MQISTIISSFACVLHICVAVGLEQRAYREFKVAGGQMQKAIGELRVAEALPLLFLPTLEGALLSFEALLPGELLALLDESYCFLLPLLIKLLLIGALLICDISLASGFLLLILLIGVLLCLKLLLVLAHN